MASQNLVNIGSNNGLLPDGTKPLPGLILAYHQWGPSCGIHQRAVSLKMLKISMGLKSTDLKLHPHLRGQWVKMCERAAAMAPINQCQWCLRSLARAPDDGQPVPGSKPSSCGIFQSSAGELSASCSRSIVSLLAWVPTLCRYTQVILTFRM